MPEKIINPLEYFLCKKVYVHIDTKDGVRRYSGTLIEITYLGKTIDGFENYFLLIEETAGTKVGFTSTQIKLIEEEK